MRRRSPLSFVVIRIARTDHPFSCLDPFQSDPTAAAIDEASMQPLQFLCNRPLHLNLRPRLNLLRQSHHRSLNLRLTSRRRTETTFKLTWNRITYPFTRIQGLHRRTSILRTSRTIVGIPLWLEPTVARNRRLLKFIRRQDTPLLRISKLFP